MGIGRSFNQEKVACKKKAEILQIGNLSGNWAGEMIGRGANGEVEAVLLTLRAIKDAQGYVTHYIGILSSISLLLERQYY